MPPCCSATCSTRCAACCTSAGVSLATATGEAVVTGTGSASCFTENTSSDGSPGIPTSAQVPTDPSRNAPSPSPISARVWVRRRPLTAEAVEYGSAMVPLRCLLNPSGFGPRTGFLAHLPRQSQERRLVRLRGEAHLALALTRGGRDTRAQRGNAKRIPGNAVAVAFGREVARRRRRVQQRQRS